jgi:hypothetical protein
MEAASAGQNPEVIQLQSNDAAARSCRLIAERRIGLYRLVARCELRRRLRMSHPGLGGRGRTGRCASGARECWARIGHGSGMIKLQPRPVKSCLTRHFGKNAPMIMEYV